MLTSVVQNRLSAAKMMRAGDWSRGEIIEFTDPFSDRDLMDVVYGAYLTLLVPYIRAETKKDHDGVFRAIMNGWYLPCEARAVFTGQVQQRVDPLPQAAGLFAGKGFYSAVRAVDKAPGFVSPAPGRLFEVVRLMEDNGEIRAARHYAVVTADDRVVSCLDLSVPAMDRANSRGYYNSMAIDAAITMNAVADARHLWNVRTMEETFGGLHASLTLGVGEERVKSLFYARSLPVTETGRKRPILHWVKAHERRLASGIDIDVSKHLRGIETFEMEGFQFEITQPRKPPALPRRRAA